MNDAAHNYSGVGSLSIVSHEDVQYRRKLAFLVFHGRFAFPTTTGLWILRLKSCRADLIRGFLVLVGTCSLQHRLQLAPAPGAWESDEKALGTF